MKMLRKLLKEVRSTMTPKLGVHPKWIKMAEWSVFQLVDFDFGETLVKNLLPVTFVAWMYYIEKNSLDFLLVDLTFISFFQLWNQMNGKSYVYKLFVLL